MGKEIVLSDAVKQLLQEAVILWADENLIGKPALLANAMFFALEKAMINEIKKINECNF